MTWVLGGQVDTMLVIVQFLTIEGEGREGVEGAGVTVEIVGLTAGECPICRTLTLT